MSTPLAIGTRVIVQAGANRGTSGTIARRAPTPLGDGWQYLVQPTTLGHGRKTPPARWAAHAALLEMKS